MNQTVLVTGGAGFIGSFLVPALLARGYRVRVLDNLSGGRREWVPAEAEFVEGDVRDAARCLESCQGCAGVFHLAAMSRSAASLDNVETCTESNVVGTQNILQAARQAGVRKVVYSGSSTYYGSQPPPHVETLPPQYLNAYGLSKHVGEEYCLLFDRLYNVPTVVLRYFNVYGPRQPEEGIYSLVVGAFLKMWREGRPLLIHGTGEQRRDFIHVRDIARANILAFEADVRNVVINIGSGTSFSVRELADMISSRQVSGPARVADAAETLADITRARTLLGWEPQVGFAEGLRELMDEAAGTVASHP